MDEKELLKLLEDRIAVLDAIQTNPAVRDRVLTMLEKEIEFHAFLLGLGHEKLPSKQSTFGAAVKEKTKMGWQDWVKTIFKKINDLATKLIPGLGVN